MSDNGASCGPGSREPSPSVSAASGFDPSRVAFLTRDADTKEPIAVSYCGHLSGFLECVPMFAMRGRNLEFSVTPKSAVAAGKEWFERTFEAAKWPWISWDHLLSIASDSDEHRNGEDAKRLSGEAMPARAEGIATPPALASNLVK